MFAEIHSNSFHHAKCLDHEIPLNFSMPLAGESHCLYSFVSCFLTNKFLLGQKDVLFGYCNREIV